MGKYTALLMAEGLEECEALNVVDLLRRAGVDVRTVSLNADRHVTGSNGIGIDTDMTMDELYADREAFAAAEDLEMLILPGGMPGTKNLGNSAKVIGLIAEMNRQEKWLAAICAAPSVFAQAGFLTGRKATSYPAFMEVLDEAGAQIQEKAVVVDGHFVTSRGLGTAIPFGLTLIRVLKGQEKAEEIRDSIVSDDAIF